MYLFFYFFLWRRISLHYRVLACFWDGSAQFIAPYSTIGTSNGKALLWYLIFPLIAESGMEVYDENSSKNTWITFALQPLVASCATATGIYTIPVYYVVIAFPYVFHLVIKKSKKIWFIIRNMIFSMLPIGIYAVCSISSTKNTRAEQLYLNLMI